MAYNTALRRYTAKRIEEIRNADILVGIPCYNNEKTIGQVIQMVTHGLDKHYRDFRSVIFVADGARRTTPGRRPRNSRSSPGRKKSSRSTGGRPEKVRRCGPSSRRPGRFMSAPAP